MRALCFRTFCPYESRQGEPAVFIRSVEGHDPTSHEPQGAIWLDPIYTQDRAFPHHRHVPLAVVPPPSPPVLPPAGGPGAPTPTPISARGLPLWTMPTQPAPV